MAFNSLSGIKTIHPWDTDQKWYMLQRNTDRLESCGEAKAGSIFQIDYNETKSRSSGRHGANIVLENIEHEGQKVLWQPELFISLDDDLKAPLLAVDDPKERLHIYTVPENATFDVSVVDAVANTANERWKILASHLPIEQHELDGKLQTAYSPHASLHLVFDIWQQKEPGCHKIWKLIDACRKTGMEDVAADIEQGLSKHHCRNLAKQIGKSQWKKFGERLSLSRTRLDAFGLKFCDLADRVFHMLCYWTMTSSLNTDKIDVLSKALWSCNESDEANELKRDLSEEELETTAALIDTNWIRLASHLSQYEVDNIMKSPCSPVEKALLVLKIWKRRQPLENKRLKRTFYWFLVEKKFYKAARWLYDGLDDETVVQLANKLCFEWTLLAKHFGYGLSEISRRFFTTDQLDMSYIMLKELLNANKDNDTKETKRKLFNGLKVIGRDDLVEWIEGRLSDTADEKTSTKCDTNLRQDLSPSLEGGTPVDITSNIEQSQGAVGGESTPEFNVHSMVKVDWDGEKRRGVIQWIGVIKGLENHGEIAGIELKDALTVGGTNGWFCNVKYFTCEAGKGLFLPLSRCRPESRFLIENERKLKKTEHEFTSFSPEEETHPKEIGQEGERKKKLLKEVEDLQNQLEKMKTTYADTVKRLEESQKLMLTLESKNAELETELHHPKLNLASQQEEVERLKKELEDGKKLTYLGNEPVKESTEGCSGDASSPVGMRESRSLEDFGKFQFHLSSYLTRDIIRDLTLVLAFSPTESEQAEDDKIKFVRLLRGKGLISPTDITKLTNALYEIGQHGVWNAVKNLFDRNPSEAFR